MILSLSRLARAGGLLALIFLISLFFVLSRSSLVDREKEVVNQILQFKQVDSEINELILRTEFNLLHNYDPLVGGIKRLREASGRLKETLVEETGDPQALAPLFEKVDIAIDDKERLLERYKRANALRKNSQRYFPIVAREFQRLLMARPHPSPAEMDDLFGLMREILEQKYQDADVFHKQVEKWASRIMAHTMSLDAEKQAQTSIVLHARMVADGIVTTERMIQDLLAFPMATTIDELYEGIRLLSQQDRKRGDRYRLLIFVTAVFLLIYISYLLMRLRRTIRTLGEQKFALDQHAAVTTTDINWRITNANRAMAKLSHYPSFELVGRDLWTVDGGAKSDRLRKEVTASVERGIVWKGEYQSLDSEGRPYWVDVAVVPFLDERDKPVSYTTIRTDITGRKVAEQERVRLHMAIEQAADSIVITDAKGDIEYANPAFERVTGYGKEEVLGLNPRFLKSDKHGEMFYRQMWSDLTSGKVWEGKMINRRKSGELYEEEARISPVLDSTGAIINYVAVKSDVTRREMLVKAREFFSAIASHELRTPLTKLQLVKMMLGQGADTDIERATTVLDECYDDLEKLIASTSLLSELQMSLPDKQKVPTALGPMVLSAVDIAQTQAFSKGRELTFDVRLSEDSRDLTIQCDPHLILKALGAVLENAVLYSHKGGDVIVSCLKKGGWLEVVVVDQGIGMSQTALELVREPFFSSADPGHHYTRRGGDVGEGIGLGLTISTLIVEAHGGRLLLESQGEGKGVTARFLFPFNQAGAGA